MKICKICKTENNNTDDICKYCGSYLGFSKFHKFLIIGLFIWPVLIYVIYLAIKDSIKIKEIREKNNINISDIVLNQIKNISMPENTNTFNSFCVNPDEHVHRDSDGTLQRGAAEIILNDKNLIIKQNTEIVSYDMDSIYYFGLWNYGGETFFKFRMRNLNEYKFKSIHSEADKIAQYLKTLDIEIQDSRE